MEFIRGKTVTFSGYRPHKFDFPLSQDNAMYEKLTKAGFQAIIKAMELGYENFLLGGAPGFDILCMELISLARKLTQQDNKLICALPYGDFRNSSYFTDEWRTRYDAAINSCDHIFNVTGNEHETRGCFQRRNEFMVDNSDMLICYHTGKPGGTANTISYAKTKGSIIVNIAALL